MAKYRVYHTTKADYKRFQSQVKYWMDFFGLKDWEIYFHHFGDSKEYRAQCTPEWEPRLCEFRFAKTMSLPPEEGEVDRLAFHEVQELIQSKLRIMALNAGVEWQVVDEAVHVIIRTMENTVFTKCRDLV